MFNIDSKTTYVVLVNIDNFNSVKWLLGRQNIVVVPLLLLYEIVSLVLWPPCVFY